MFLRLITGVTMRGLLGTFFRPVEKRVMGKLY